MTNPLGPGTINATVNLTKEEWTLLARRAARTDRSLGSLLRGLVLEGLRSADRCLADQVQRIREVHRLAVARRRALDPRQLCFPL